MSKPILVASIVFAMMDLWIDSLAWAADTRAPARASATNANAAQASEIARLVRELGAATFMARQHAQRALVALGVKAQPALEAASQNPDQEIRLRARGALAAIADVDFHSRLGAFLADLDGDGAHGLAGWQRFRSLVGSSPAARRLFADMQRAERDLLERVAEMPARSAALLEARCQQVETLTQDSDSNRHGHLSLGTTAALFFAASNRDVPITGHAGNCLNTLGSQNNLSQALHARPTGALVRGLLNAWVSRPFDHDSLTGYRNLWLAMQYNLKDALEPALALIEPPAAPPHLEPFAILAIGKLGSREHIAALKPLLKDDRPIDPADRGGQKSDTQIRDVALAAMIHLSGQKLADFGFAHAKSHAFLLFNTTSLGFNDPSARTEALKKWRAWEAKQAK
jgi:hypothetical protein